MRRTPIVFLAFAAAMTMLAGPAFAVGPASPHWSSTAPFGAWNNNGFIIYNNEWNQPTGPQRIWADSYHSWGAQSKQAAGNTAVETYPCVQRNYNNPQVMACHLIRNGFAESMPHAPGLDAEAADDIWLNHYKIEVMIWVDNHGQRPGGDIIGHATIFGQHFAVWHGGTDYTFALDHKETTGVTHILASVAWLIHHGQLASNVTLTQVNFGWEIASTGGKQLNFKVTNYWLHSRQ